MRQTKTVLCVLVALLFCSTLIFYVSLNQVDREQGQELNKQSLVFHEDSPEQYVLSRMVDVQRKNHLRNQCRLMNYSDDLDSVLKDQEFLSHVIVDKEHKMLYCYVPKVACTNWKRVLMVLMQKTNVTKVLDITASLAHSQNMFMKLVNYTTPEVEQMLKTYTKFMFVRHPLERLLSAYKNKLQQNYESSKYFKKRYGRLIIQMYRPNASPEALERADDVTFQEFASYVSDTQLRPNEHWQPAAELCRPCAVHYDVVGKYESLKEDADFVLSHVSRTVRFPELPKPSNTNANLKTSLDALPELLLERLQQIYEADFRLFDYQPVL
ncbi:carbohydrate sulfotransferase 11 isoform X2 [Neocloeon triangulifer]|uniref:carbohydrate sulfotransferase 11 isoform X2 n=1 Tax=Neocloeon triangulifer TaxID=2078957 RepID=UPI00286F0438|nr:carbohydrate sulfotransferase 11 isoform X2 [Neocloeon triangulifer]